MRQEIFTAVRGAGAHLENRRMRVSKQRDARGRIAGDRLSVSRATNARPTAYFATLRALSRVTAGIRRPGSAALDLAYVAAGRVDGFWELGLKPWDTAAGTLMIQEAGGRVGTLERR